MKNKLEYPKMIGPPINKVSIYLSLGKWLYMFHYREISSIL